MADENNQPAAPQRPEGLADKYWDATAGVKITDLLTDHNALSTRFAKGKEALIPEIRAQLEPELTQTLTAKLTPEITKTVEGARFKARPEKVDGYKLDAPTTGLPEGLVLLNEPPGKDFQREAGKQYYWINPQDPVLGFFRQQAWEAGMSQEQFTKGLGAYVAAHAATQTASQTQLQEWRTKDRATLGEHADARVKHVIGQMTAIAGEGVVNALDLEYMPAAGLAALEMVLEKAGGAKFSPSSVGGGADGSMTQQQLEAIQAEPDYWESPEKQARVAAGYKKLIPGSTGPNLGPSARA